MPTPNPFRTLDGHAPDLTPPTPEPWMDSALCAQVGDPELWFGLSQSAFSATDEGQRESVAKSVCARCEVKAECLEFALRTDERYGIYGGLTRKERLDYKRARRTA